MTLQDSKKPVILISGAGIAGLIMPILLESLEVPYQILERAESVKPLGM
jgi:cation diffusion facilitator CzcD-associated flavoprotein CzcO